MVFGEIVAHRGVRLIGLGWAAFLTENVVLSHNRGLFVEQVGEDVYKCVLAPQSATSVCGTTRRSPKAHTHPASLLSLPLSPLQTRVLVPLNGCHGSNCSGLRALRPQQWAAGHRRERLGREWQSRRPDSAPTQCWSAALPGAGLRLRVAAGAAAAGSDCNGW